jgi:hypothetical protein
MKTPPPPPPEMDFYTGDPSSGRIDTVVLIVVIALAPAVVWVLFSWGGCR